MIFRKRLNFGVLVAILVSELTLVKLQTLPFRVSGQDASKQHLNQSSIIDPFKNNQRTHYCILVKQ